MIATSSKSITIGSGYIIMDLDEVSITGHAAPAAGPIIIAMKFIIRKL